MPRSASAINVAKSASLRALVNDAEFVAHLVDVCMNYVFCMLHLVIVRCIIRDHREPGHVSGVELGHVSGHELGHVSGQGHRGNVLVPLIEFSFL